MKTRLALIFGLGLSAVASASGDEPRMHFSKALDRGTATGEEILAVQLDSDIYAATRDGYPDLRIVDDRGATVPYLLEPVARRRTAQVRLACASKVESLHVDEGKGLEIVVELENDAPNAVGATIRTPLVDYERRVRVFGSRSGADWVSLVDEAVIFDYSRFMDVRNRDIVIPTNEFRRFKFVVEHKVDDHESPLREMIRKRSDGKKDEEVEITQSLRRPFRIDGIELWRTVESDREKKAETFRYDTVSFHVEPDPKNKETRVEVQTRREPLTRLSLETSSRNFSRQAKVLIPVERGVHTDWVEIGHGALSLIQFRAYRHAELRIDFAERRYDRYQLVIENADNPPLEITGVDAEGLGYRVVFLGTEGRTYQVHYGSNTADAPNYDTGTVLASLRKGFQPVTVKLGPQVANPDYKPSRGNLLNSTAVLALAIVVMVLVLAWALFRAGQRIKSLPQQEI